MRLSDKYRCKLLYEKLENLRIVSKEVGDIPGAFTGGHSEKDGNLINCKVTPKIDDLTVKETNI